MADLVRKEQCLYGRIKKYEVCMDAKRNLREIEQQELDRINLLLNLPWYKSTYNKTIKKYNKSLLLPVDLSIVLESLIILLNLAHFLVQFLFSFQKSLHIFPVTVFIENYLEFVVTDRVLSEKWFSVDWPAFGRRE